MISATIHLVFLKKSITTTNVESGFEHPAKESVFGNVRLARVSILQNVVVSFSTNRRVYRITLNPSITTEILTVVLIFRKMYGARFCSHINRTHLRSVCQNWYLSAKLKIANCFDLLWFWSNTVIKISNCSHQWLFHNVVNTCYKFDIYESVVFRDFYSRSDWVLYWTYYLIYKIIYIFRVSIIESPGIVRTVQIGVIFNSTGLVRYSIPGSIVRINNQQNFYTNRKMLLVNWSGKKEIKYFKSAKFLEFLLYWNLHWVGLLSKLYKIQKVRSRC